MEINDFWDEIRTVFEGQSDQIQEIDLIKLKAGSMAQCLEYLLSNAKDCNSRFTMRGTEIQVQLASPQSLVSNVVQEEVSVAMWLSFPALPMLSIYIDFADEISFGFVRGAWNVMAVLAFFDLLHKLKLMSPGAEFRPSIYTFTQSERDKLLKFWQDYE